MRMHGGYAATLIDSATGLRGADQASRRDGLRHHRTQGQLRPQDRLPSTGRLLCTGTVIHAGRTMFTAEARVIDENGKLYAHGSGTFLVYPT